MPAPTAERLLAAWELAVACPPLERAMTLAGLARPDTDDDARWALSVGELDAALLGLRAALFGPTLTAVGACPGCGSEVELSVAAHTLAAAGEAPAGDAWVALDGYDVEVRPPTCAALAEAGRAADAEAARACLLAAAVRSATCGGTEVAADELPVAVTAALEARLAALDPLADVRLAVRCPACGEESDPALDIAAFVWAEVDVWARRTLQDVDQLARAYGWSEAEILALGPRREVYLQMATA